jgi:hypothetical protein
MTLSESSQMDTTSTESLKTGFDALLVSSAPTEEKG